jgi:hypothetical protein
VWKVEVQHTLFALIEHRGRSTGLPRGLVTMIIGFCESGADSVLGTGITNGVAEGGSLS